MPVLGNSDTLATFPDAVPLVAACVDNIQLPSMNDAGAGVDAVFILFPVGDKGGTLAFPMDHILRSEQPPLLIRMVQAETVPLVEKIIDSVELDQSVWIV